MTQPREKAREDNDRRKVLGFNQEVDMDVDYNEKDVRFFDILDCVGVLRVCNNTNETKPSFMGYCLDYGAARIVVSRRQYEFLCRDVNHQLKIRPSPTSFRFGKTTFQNKRKVVTRLRVSLTLFVEFSV